ncbi:arginine--tRNA ligase [Podospora australis]|uniref:arginine--tRNA ligase n=1 Tax=Podospora australis TaxID=1536484 RepID=A0AAN6WW55_9PEZI|nr:arginine--tRNA ligase [Podospora australis]
MDHHSHGGGGFGDTSFSVVNMDLARRFWYIIAGFVGAFLLCRVVNTYKSQIRLRRRTANSVEFPTKPSNRVLELWATFTAVAREASYPQLHIPIRGVSWLTPPPMGRVIVLVVYWIVVIYMMTHEAIYKDAFHWERIGFRNAWITVTQVPLLYLLASKCNVVGFIIGTSHERLNWLHRWVARTMLVTATLHGWHFYADWARSELVEYQIKLQPMVKYGFGAWGILLWACISSFAPLRRLSYEFFVLQHLLTAALFLWAVYIHIPVEARYNVWFAIAALCFDRVCRTVLLVWQNVKFLPDKARCNGGQRIGHQAQLRAVGDSITVITVKDVHFKWRAGQHLYLWMPRVGIAEAHPYTIACAHQLPETCICNSIQLVVRKHGGFSKRLHNFATKAQAAGKRDRLTVFVSGPYGAPPRWDIYETIILISASTGASFTLPILESVQQTKSTNCVKRIDFLLTTKQGEEIDFYVARLHELIEQAKDADIELNVHIAVTQGSSTFANAQEGTKIREVGISSSSSSGTNLPATTRKQVQEKTSGRPPSPNSPTDIEQTAPAVPVERRRSSNASTDSHVFYSSVRPDVEAFIRGPVEATGGETSVVTARSYFALSRKTPLEEIAQKQGASIADDLPNCYPESNPYDVYRAYLSRVLQKVTGISQPQKIYNAISQPRKNRGDLALSVPAALLEVIASQKEVSKYLRRWEEHFPEDDPLFKKPVIDGRFLNFYFKPGPLVQSIVPWVREKDIEFGSNKMLGLKDRKNPSQGKKKIIVEFSSPNIAKPFHAGHLRSTILGGFLANVYESAGWDVTRMNYLGDWGKQYGLLAVAFNRYGDENALKEDPINHLFQLYVRINAEMTAENEELESRKAKGEDVTKLEANSLDEQARKYFRKMTDRDAEAIDQWQRFRTLSIERYRQTYDRLNIRFDQYSGESQVSEEDMSAIDKELENRGITRDEDGARLIDFESHSPRLPRVLVRKKDGTALYITRDISELLARHREYQFDKMLYVVARPQEIHFKQLFTILERLGHQDICAKCEHISFGMVRGMSTRKGTVKFLDDILRDVADKMHEVMVRNKTKYQEIADPAATADTLAISSLMIRDMRADRIKDYQFNMDDITRYEGETGPHLQYAHVRMCSMRRQNDLSNEQLASADLSLLTEPHAVNIARTLVEWPDVVNKAREKHQPQVVVQYLFRLADEIGSAWVKLKVEGTEHEVMKARMAVFDAARIVLRNGMQLLGMNPLERM